MDLYHKEKNRTFERIKASEGIEDTTLLIDPYTYFFFDNFGIIVSDFNSLSEYLETISYYDLFYHFLFLKSNVEVLDLDFFTKFDKNIFTNNLMNNEESKIFLNKNNNILINYNNNHKNYILFNEKNLLDFYIINLKMINYLRNNRILKQNIYIYNLNFYSGFIS